MTELLEKRRSLHQTIELYKERDRQLQKKLEEIQPLSNMGTILAMTAHEINNILTPLENYAQLAQSYPDDRKLAEKAIKKTVSNSARASKILQAMISMADGNNHQKSQVSVNELFDEVFTCIARDFEKDNIKVINNTADDVKVNVEKILFEQVLLNLILNARDAMIEKGGVLELSADCQENSVCISICDTGNGIENDALDKIFDPFYSTKNKDCHQTNGGSGLGLAFCKNVIDSHKGKIEVQSQPGKGTLFTITLPK